MLPIFLAMLLGMLCPSHNASNNGHPSVQTYGDGDDGGTGGDTGHVIPPKPPKPNNP